jgi:hypothetical protein
MSLRRFYHRHVRHRHRFNVAIILTIVAIAWIVVPAVVSVIESLARYDPTVYEPKDIERGVWMRRQMLSVEHLTLENLLKLALFVFVGLAWLMLAPTLQRSSRPRR